MRNTATQRIGNTGPSGTTVANLQKLCWPCAMGQGPTNTEEALIYERVKNYAQRAVIFYILKAHRIIGQY